MLVCGLWPAASAISQPALLTKTLSLKECPGHGPLGVPGGGQECLHHHGQHRGLGPGVVQPGGDSLSSGQKWIL